jgi:hypothetical protein
LDEPVLWIGYIESGSGFGVLMTKNLRRKKLPGVQLEKEVMYIFSQIGIYLSLGLLK